MFHERIEPTCTTNNFDDLVWSKLELSSVHEKFAEWTGPYVQVV